MHRGAYFGRAGEHKAMRFKTAKQAAEGRDARPRRVVKGRCASAAKARHATPGDGACVFINPTTKPTRNGLHPDVICYGFDFGCTYYLLTHNSLC